MGVLGKEYFEEYKIGSRVSSQEFRDKVSSQGTGALVKEDQKLEDADEQLPHPVRNFTLKRNKLDNTE